MTKASSKTTTAAVKHATLGFGVPATSDPHHFKVIIPKGNCGKVQISEYLGLQAQSEEFSVIDRVLLERSRWTLIRAEVQRAFNARLKSYNLNTCSWQAGENIVDRLLGKELCVLAWAVEGMDIDNIPLAVRNWLALRPEERWWLFGMTAKSTGGVDDGDVGWRIALRHALGDIVQAEQTELSQEPEISLKRQSTKSFDINSPSDIRSNLSDNNDVAMMPKDKGSKGNLSKDPDRVTPPDEQTQNVSTTEESLFLFEAKLAKAIGQPVGDKSSPEFLVKKGSTANMALAKSLRPAIRELRQQLLDDDILVKEGDVYAFTHEYVFKSPSAAACVVAGNPRSGMDAWKDMQGHSLKELGYGKKD
jgi:hypothetical protein